METLKINSNATTKFFLTSFAAIFAIIFLASIILYSKPMLVTNDIVDFAVHHYFLTAFIALILFLICIKYYFTYTEAGKRKYAIKKNYRASRMLKRKERMQHFSKQFSLKIQTIKSQFIDKSKVNDLYFSKTDVLDSIDEITKRNQDLQVAMKLGNNYKHKVKLFFKDKFTNKHLETTIWYTDSNYVTLKGGIILPVKSIYKVEI